MHTLFLTQFNLLILVHGDLMHSLVTTRSNFNLIVLCYILRLYVFNPVFYSLLSVRERSFHQIQPYQKAELFHYLKIYIKTKKCFKNVRHMKLI